MRLTKKEKGIIINTLSDRFVRLGDEGLDDTKEARELEKILDKLEE